MWSLTTPYGMNNDFHFTIHLALLMVVFNELWANRYFKLAITSGFVLLFQTIMVLTLRGAYLIDAFGGVAFGHFFWIAGMWMSYYVDVKLLDLGF